MTSLSVLSTDIRSFDGLFCLNDLHKAAGNEKRHKPNNWLRMEQTQELIGEIQFSDMRTAVKTINGGQERGTYACKELVYAYAMWISARFHLKVIRAFDAISQGDVANTAELTKLQSQHITLQSKYIQMLEAAREQLTVARGWTTNEDAKLLELKARGLNATQIGAELGRSSGSVKGRLRRLKAQEAAQ